VSITQLFELVLETFPQLTQLAQPARLTRLTPVTVKLRRPPWQNRPA
jgi:hypothetical protein